MKTRKEIDDLKANWKHDPCWDIEDTEGFEAHRKELLTWRNVYERAYEKKEKARIEERATEFKCSPELIKHIEFLEALIRKNTKY